MKHATMATLILALVGAILATPVAARNSLDQPTNNSYLIPLGVADTNRDGTLSGAEAQNYCATHPADCQIFWQRLQEGNQEAHDFARTSGLAALVDESEIVELGTVTANNEWDVAGKSGWYEKRKLSPRTRGYNHPAYGPWGRENCTNIVRPCGQLPTPRPPVEPAPLVEPDPEPLPEEPFVPTAIVVEHRVSGSLDVNVHGTVGVQASLPAQVNCPGAYQRWAGPDWFRGRRVNTPQELAVLWLREAPEYCEIEQPRQPPVARCAPPPVYQQPCPPPRRGGGWFVGLARSLWPPPQHFVPPRPQRNEVRFIQGPPVTVTQNNNQNTNVNVR